MSKKDRIQFLKKEIWDLMSLEQAYYELNRNTDGIDKKIRCYCKELENLISR